MSLEPCYADLREKLWKFPRQVIPAIFAEADAGTRAPELWAWLQAAGIGDYPRGMPQILALHELARAGAYRQPLRWNCDPRQPVAQTLAAGGDCDQWAPVLLAALELLGFDGALITFGDGADPYQHIAAAAWFDRRWRVMDAKGDQRGLDFGQVDATYQNLQVWRPPWRLL